MPVDALGILTALVLEDGRPWGDAATDVQLADAAAVLSGAVPYHAISRARGYSKTTDLAGIALASALAAPHASRLYWAASDLDQGRLALDSIAGFCGRTDVLRSDEIEIGSRSVTIRATGTRIEVLPADAPGAWGLRPYMVVADELAQWPETDSARRLWEALTSAMLKVAGARLAIITTAGSPTHWAAKVFESARADELWRVSETLGPAPWSDRAMLDEQRRRLPEGVYANLFENTWQEAAGAFFITDRLDECFCLEPQGKRVSSARHFAGLDLGLVNDATAFAVGHREGEQVHLDLLKVWRGKRKRPVDLDDVEAAVREAYREFGFKLSVDPYQAASLIQRLRRTGLPVKPYNFSQGSKTKLAQTLLQAVNDGTLKLFEAEGLRDELAALRVRQLSSGAWGFDHARGRHDDMATALALMTLAAVEANAGRLEVRAGPWNRAVSDPFRESTERVHDQSPRHRRWSMHHYCAECASDWREYLAANGMESEAQLPTPRMY